MFVRCRWTGLWELLKMNNNKSRIYSSSDCVGLKIITYVLLSIRAFISSKGWKNSVSYSTFITWRAFAYMYSIFKPSHAVHPSIFPSFLLNQGCGSILRFSLQWFSQRRQGEQEALPRRTTSFGHQCQGLFCFAHDGNPGKSTRSKLETILGAII